MGKQINGIRFFDDIPSKYKYIQLEKTVKKANIIPKPLGFGLVCMLLGFGISINFFLNFVINKFNNLLLKKKLKINIKYSLGINIRSLYF